MFGTNPFGWPYFGQGWAGVLDDGELTLGQATETDTANALTPRKLVTLGQAAETDTANALTPARGITLGQALETDVANALALTKYVDLGRAGGTGGAGVAHDAASESHGEGLVSSAEASFQWSHDPAAAPAGVLVWVFTSISTVDNVTGVTYDGVNVPLVAAAVALDTAGENTRLSTYFLGEGVPATDPATIIVSRVNNGNNMYAMAATVTADGDVEIYEPGIVLVQEDGTLAEESVDDGSPGTASLRYAAISSGLPAVPSPGANSTPVISNDIGARVVALVRETATGQGSRSVGFDSVTTDDRAAVHLAVRQLSAVTDTANAITPLHQVTLGQAVEVDEAFELEPTQPTPVALDRATETDTANSLTPRHEAALAQAVETDTAGAISPVKHVALGQALETDEAFDLTPAEPGTVPLVQADETDTAFALTPRHEVALGQALEGDTANSLTPVKRVALGQATETNTANGFTTSKLVALGMAAEVSTANSLTPVHQAVLGMALETDTAGSLSPVILVPAGGTSYGGDGHGPSSYGGDSPTGERSYGGDRRTAYAIGGDRRAE